MALRLEAAPELLPSASSPARRSHAVLVVAAASLVSLALALSQDFRERFYDQIPKSAADGYHQTDLLAQRYSHGTGLFLRFIGFTSLPQNIRYYPINVYLRVTYALYPQRVLLAQPTDSISMLQDIETFNFTPDNPWLIAHKLGAMLIYDVQPDGTMNVSVQNPNASPQTQ
jgi:hypothetical protein